MHTANRHHEKPFLSTPRLFAVLLVVLLCAPAILAQNPPRTGACCYPDGTCDDGVTETVCEGSGGTYQGDGILCINSDCQDKGACCLAGGGCSTMTPEICSLIQGVFQGLDSDCATAGCTPPPSWACCVAGACTEQTARNCQTLGGTFLDNTPCSQATCVPPPIGACCYDGGGCEDGVTAVDCTNSGGNFRGGGTDCDSTTCPIIEKGACCNGQTCTIKSSQECGAFGGSYYGDNSVCPVSTNLCANPPTGGCCIQGSCSTLTEASCLDNGGSYLGVGVSCDQGCPPVGACCDGAGACTDSVTELTCNAVAGGYQGDGSLCVNSTCTGACCNGDGTCDDKITLETCGLLGFMGYGSSCDQVSCEGGCCDVEGNCSLTTSDSCYLGGGFFQGPGTICSAAFACPERGACCLLSGLCLEVEPAACAEGTFHSKTSCANAQCSAVGACCAPDNTCTVVSQDFCGTVLGGTYHGDSTTCPQPSCQQTTGVCCSANGACTETTANECSTSESSDYLGDGTVCEAGICKYMILIFEDGFEFGNTSAWSSTAP